MPTLHNLVRRPAPAKRLFPIAYLGGTIWAGSWDDDVVYGLDPQSLAIQESYPAPGRPYGIAALGSELRIVVGPGGVEDDRYIYRFVPGRGFDLDGRTECPELTGSNLASRDSALYLAQLSFERIAVLKTDGTIQRTIALPARCAGISFGPDGFYIIAGDAELHQLTFGSLDVSQDAPAFEEIAPLPREARSLAFDGTRWWTNLRDLNEVATFTTSE